MAVEVEIDVQVLKSEIKKTYASVSQEPEKDFIFPTGRPWAEDLGYPEELANVPETAVGSFAGVANPWQLGRLKAGERGLDLGSGAGTDSPVAAQMVGEDGHVTRLDMTPEMLTKARAAQGAQVRRPRHDRQGVQAGALANAAARRRGGRAGGDRRAPSARRETHGPARMSRPT